MEKRGQFTFYRSFWEAVQGLPKKDRLPILEAVIAYALDGMEPVGLTKQQSSYFLLVRPVLDTARRRSANGRLGGSKTKANKKQTVSEKDIEKDIDIDIDKDKDIDIEYEPYKEPDNSAYDLDGAFQKFWAEYPNPRGRDGAYSCWVDMDPSPAVVEEIMTGLAIWKISKDWTEEGGRYVPSGYKFLSLAYWMAPPMEAKRRWEDTYGKTL